MISLLEHLYESLILEWNIKVFPEKGKFAKLSWWKGEHCEERQKERNVKDSEITDALFGAYNDIKELFKNNKLKVSKTGKDSNFIIVDARKQKENPICVVGFLRKNDHPNKLDKPSFTIMTVFKKNDENQKNFSALMRNGSRNNEEIIWLY